MKCPTCNAWTNVLESRPIKLGVKRRRECANLHRFTTYETELNHEELDMSTGRRVLTGCARFSMVKPGMWCNQDKETCLKVRANKIKVEKRF